VRNTLFPVRCFTCGALIGHLWEPFKESVEKRINELREKGVEIDKSVLGKVMIETLNDLGVKRYCCRRMFLSHVDIYVEIMKFPRIT